MISVLEQVRDLFEKAIGKAFGAEFAEWAHVSRCQPETFGHYQCTTAMRLGKETRQNPRACAEKILAAFDKPSFIEKIEIAGPGYLNVTLSNSFLSKDVTARLKDAHLGVKAAKRQRVIVEFSSPNVAKELHVGHLRSSIIGDALARCLEFLGHDVVRLNHIGDWGTQFGMIITYIRDEDPDVLSGKKIVDLPTLQNWYKQSKVRFDNDIEFKKRSQLQVVALQALEPEAVKAWNIICEISRRSYNEIYRLLDVKLQERGESFYNPVLPKTVADLQALGLVEVSNGAKCIFIPEVVTREGTPMPLMVQKSDGGYNYDTTDMAAMRQRVAEEKAERIIIVTDAGQANHFKMVAIACKRAGWLPDSVQFDHVPTGMVLGPDGTKFKTRSGESEKLIDLLTKAVDFAKAELIKRGVDQDLSAEELEKTAEALGLGAVKYADLSTNRTGDYTFSYEKMLRFDGNTAAFLLYAYVRVSGIKRKLGQAVDLNAPLQIEHPSEVALALQLIAFADTLTSCAKELLPNRLADYLFNLAERFHAFFRDCQVIGSEQQASRLVLCEAVAKTLATGLHLLGLRLVDRM